MGLSEEHQVGALLLAVASLSEGRYVLIRKGRNRQTKMTEWRVTVRYSRRDYVSQDQLGLVGALDRAWQRLKAMWARAHVSPDGMIPLVQRALADLQDGASARD